MLASSGSETPVLESVRPGEALSIYRNALERIQELRGPFNSVRALQMTREIARNALNRAEPLLAGRSTPHEATHPTEAK